MGESVKYKLRMRMILINTALTLVPLILFGIITYGIFINNTNAIMTDTVNVMFKQISSRLDEYFDSINTVSKIFFFDQDFQQALYRDRDVRDSETYIQVTKQLNSIMLMNPTVIDAYLITDTGRVIGVRQEATGFELTALMDSVRSNPNNISFNAIKGEGEKQFIAAVRPIKEINSLENMGYGVLLIDKEKLSGMMERTVYNAKMEIMLMDHKGNPVVVPESGIEIPMWDIRLSEDKNTSTFKSGGQTYRYVRHISEETGWEMLAVVSEKDLYEDTNLLAYSMAFYILLIFGLVVLVTFLTNMQITKPITKLTYAINKVASGDLKQKIYFKEKNEITAIADNFNHMVDEVQALTKKIFSTQQQLYESELEKKQFEIGLLQSQINSHFLYNTLSCIRGMSRKGATDEVSDMITHLVNMLRYASDLAEKVQLKDEYKNISDYVHIQRMRMGQQLNLSLDAEEGLLECEVPKMFLQPVVENSILHGFGTKDTNWMIRVRTRRRGEQIEITIMDNGCGMSSQEQWRINNWFIAKKTLLDTTKQRNSIGLMNIQNRITALYGEPYGLHIRSWLGLGTAVIITIPDTGGAEDVQGITD